MRMTLAKSSKRLSVLLSLSLLDSFSPPERYNLLLGHDVLQILLGAVKGHLLDGLGCLPGVLEVNPKKKRN